MEASCSGRCACNAPCHSTRASHISARHVAWRGLPLIFEHRHLNQTRRQHASAGSRAKRKHRHSVTAAQNSGEVAEVEELRGVRIIADAQKRPQVQYLVNWKDGTADTWQVLQLSLLQDTCSLLQPSCNDFLHAKSHDMHSESDLCVLSREPAQNLADNLLRDFEERWWSICRKVQTCCILHVCFGAQANVVPSSLTQLPYAASLYGMTGRQGSNADIAWQERKASSHHS